MMPPRRRGAIAAARSFPKQLSAAATEPMTPLRHFARIGKRGALVRRAKVHLESGRRSCRRNQEEETWRHGTHEQQSALAMRGATASMAGRGRPMAIPTERQRARSARGVPGHRTHPRGRTLPGLLCSKDKSRIAADSLLPCSSLPGRAWEGNSPADSIRASPWTKRVLVSPALDQIEPPETFRSGVGGVTLVEETPPREFRVRGQGLVAAADREVRACSSGGKRHRCRRKSSHVVRKHRLEGTRLSRPGPRRCAAAQRPAWAEAFLQSITGRGGPGCPSTGCSSILPNRRGKSKPSL